MPKQQQSSPPSTPEPDSFKPASTPPPSIETTDAEPEIPELTNLPPESEAVSLVEPQPQPEITPSPDSSPPPEPAPTPAPEEPKPPKPDAAISTDPLRLEIEATQLTWIVVKSDDDSPKEALLQPGQQASWEAQQQFTLTLGNAAGAVVRLNGETRGPFGKPGEVVREVILKP